MRFNLVFGRNYITILKLMNLITRSLLTTITAGLLITSTAHAQNLYFDPNATSSAAGGSGEFNGATSWYNGSTDVPFASGDSAYFNGAAGDVTVNAPVSAHYLEVGVTSGTENIGTTGANASQITLGPLGYNLGFYVNPMAIDAGTENVNFNSNINLDIQDQFYNDRFNTGNIPSASSGNVTFNGGITFTNDTTNPLIDTTGNSIGNPVIDLYASASGGSFTINSAVTEVDVLGSQPIQNGNYPTIAFQAANANSTLTLTSSASFTNARVEAEDGGTILDQGASFSAPFANSQPILVGGTGQYLTDVSGMTVTSGVQFVGGGGTVGSALAAETTYSGLVVGYSGADMKLTSGAGGRVNFTGDVVNGNGLGINKVGVGTVVIANATPGSENQGGAWEIKNGTMLLNGTVASNTAITGSQLTIDAVAPGSISSTQTYATLGGIGSTNVPIVAAGGSSIIAPGDPAVSGGIGTLHLLNGLQVTSGVTLAFVINGASNSVLDLGNSDFTPAGTVTMDFSSLGTVLTSVPGNPNFYTVISDTGVWDDSGATYAFNAPAGYVVARYGFDQFTGEFNVDFQVVPEPSTYALMLGGLAFLAFCVRRKNRTV
jgi:hypothetical protein